MTFTQEQLQERRGYLGASECASALGLSPFFSQVELYLDKIGEGTPIEETIPMMVGRALEPVAIALFERETQLTVIDRQRQFVDGEHPWRRCTVDGMAPDGWVVEAKSSGDYRGWGDGEDEIPQHYIFNAAHSLACIPAAPGVYFPVLIGGRTYRTYAVKRDAELIADVREGERAFMDRVQMRNIPPPKSIEDAKLLYPKDNGLPITATAEIEAAAIEVARLKRDAKATDEALKSMLTRVLTFMGPYASLRRVTLTGSQGAPLATWNSQERRSIDADALRANYPDIAAAVTKLSSTRVYLNKIKE